jgi:hypothetical protein
MASAFRQVRLNRPVSQAEAFSTCLAGAPARKRTVADEPGQQAGWLTNARARKSVCILVRVITVDRVRRTSAPMHSVCLIDIWRLLILRILLMSFNLVCSIHIAVIPWKISSYAHPFVPSPIMRQGHLVHAQQLAVRALARQYRDHMWVGIHACVGGGLFCATPTAERGLGSARGRRRIGGNSLQHSGDRWRKRVGVFDEKAVLPRFLLFFPVKIATKSTRSR